MSEHYEMKIYWDERVGEWVGVAPELNGCVVSASTELEAFKELSLAMKAWLEAANEYGWNIPEPIAGKDLQGRILLRLPKSLHRELLEEAVEEGTTLNQYCLFRLAARRPRNVRLTKLKAGSRQKAGA